MADLEPPQFRAETKAQGKRVRCRAGAREGGPMRKLPWITSALAVVLVALASGGPAAAGRPSATGGWPVAGHDIRNTRNAAEEHRIGRATPPGWRWPGA